MEYSCMVQRSRGQSGRHCLTDQPLANLPNWTVERATRGRL